jgi:sec-independent protein translocase protein TatB
VFDLSLEKLFVVLVVALVVLGPDRLPQVARALAQTKANLRRLTSTVHPDTLEALRNPRRAVMDALTESPPERGADP